MPTANELYMQYIAQGMDPAQAATRARMDLFPTNRQALQDYGYTPTQAMHGQAYAGTASPDEVQAAFLGGTTDQNGIVQTGPSYYTDQAGRDGMTFENQWRQRQGLPPVQYTPDSQGRVLAAPQNGFTPVPWSGPVPRPGGPTGMLAPATQADTVAEDPSVRGRQAVIQAMLQAQLQNQR